MQGIAVAFVALALLAVPLGIAGGVQAQDAAGRDLTPIVIGPEPTDRLGGGDLVAVRAGDAIFGVRYGSERQPNDVVIFAEYKRFLGGADIVDAEGNLVRSKGIPVFTLVGQSLNGFIEFDDRDGDGLLNFLAVNETGDIVRNDHPVKALRLNTSWALDGPTVEVAGETTYVNFTLTAADLPYDLVWDPARRHGVPADGALDSVSFTFHLEVDVVGRRARVPWYRVTIADGDERRISDVEFLEWRNVTGRAVAMGAKYDHGIVGWDFVNDTTLLALETRLLFGNYFPQLVAQFVHMAYYHDHAEDENGTWRHDPNEMAPTRPHLYTRDRIYFADDYERVGRLEWTTNVTVDGVNATMRFQVQGGERLRFEHHGAWFLGFAVRGAYIYPNGQAIQHDPAIFAESILPELPSLANLAPTTILAVQLAVVGLAMGPALYLRAKARRRT